MPDAAYVAREALGRNPEQDENTWRTVGDVASRLVADAARKIGGAA